MVKKCGVYNYLNHLISVLVLSFVAPPFLLAAPFSWHSEQLFERLENEFVLARKLSSEQTFDRFVMMEEKGKLLIAQLKAAETRVSEEQVQQLELLQFRMGSLAAGDTSLLKRMQKFINDVRQEILPMARRWQDEPQKIQQVLYRLIYGGRVAVEEAWLQSESTMLPTLLQLSDVKPDVPSTTVEGVRVYSGDILLSRAGAPTSALISRGNDYRGKFSHIALLYVDAKTRTPQIIEAHIEVGVVVSSLEDYLKDKKQRLVVLRLHPEHPQLKVNPKLAHDAASSMLERATKKLIPYDFAMDYESDKKLFCSEVVYHAYKNEGVELWQIKTLMSQTGLRAWLGAMGVKQFETLAPSDIEYDPQAVAVAEWRDLKVLRKDRLDSAIMDALLEEAERGLRLAYPVYKLPFVSVVKLWSGFQSLLGMEPAIPRGMGVETALKVNGLMQEIFPLLRERLAEAANTFRQENGYSPPYWSLMQLARSIVIQSLPELSSQLVRR